MSECSAAAPRDGSRTRTCSYLPWRSRCRLPARESGRLTCRFACHRLLAVRVQHIFEAHPLRIEVEIDVASRAVAILPHQQLGRTLDLPGAIVHRFPEEREYHIGAFLRGAERPEVIQQRTAIATLAKSRQWSRHQPP